MGGVVRYGKSKDVTIAREVLEVSPKLIRVDYVFRNLASPRTRSEPLTMGFPLPLYYGPVPYYEHGGEPPAFSVLVEGRSVPSKTVVRARQGKCADDSLRRDCGVDVTDRLRAIGLTDGQIAHSEKFNSPSDQEKKLTDRQRARLVRDGLLRDDGTEFADWTADLTYVWQLSMIPGQAVNVRHEYAPFVNGGSYAYDATEEMLRKKYCASDAQIETWKRMVKMSPTSPYGVAATQGLRVEYILTTANTWAAPIGEFVLRLKKSRPDEMVLLCFPGKFRKTDPLTFEVKLEGFRPETDLRVLFLGGAESESYFSDHVRPRVGAR